MTLNQLEYIVAVAREGNFHRAARSCHVTQPTLSALIKKLENEIELIIFDRSKKPVSPTRVGKMVVEQAKVALVEAKRISELVTGEKDELKGELRVGVIPTIAPYLVPDFLGQFAHKYPLVSLALSEMTTENCLKALDNEEIDLAILATNENRQKYFQDHLYDEKMFLYVNPKHKLAKRKKVSVNDLKAEEMWLLEEGHCLRDEIVKICHLRRVEKKRPHGLDLKIGSLESLRYLVQENFGYTLLPHMATVRIPPKEKKLLRPFSHPEPMRPILFTTRRRYLRKQLIEKLKDEILSELPKL